MLLCLFSALPMGLAGCGGSSGSTSPNPDRSADFAIITDPAGKNLLLKPGQTLPVTLDLISANGFPNLVTLSIDTLPKGWTAVFAAPTLSVLPKGVTKVVLNVTAPVDTPPARLTGVGRVKATSGGTTRYLDGGNVALPAEEIGPSNPADGINLNVAVAGVSLTPYEPNPATLAFRAGDITGRLILYAVGVTGPVTVTLANSNPGLTAALRNSTFLPTDGFLGADIPVNIHLGPNLSAGVYSFTATATTSDHTQTTATLQLHTQSAVLQGAPEISVSGAAGSAGSVGADVTITGPPYSSVNFSVADAPANLRASVMPTTSFSVPPSGTLTQHITLSAQVLQQTAPTVYNVHLTTTFDYQASQSSVFSIRVK